MNIFPFSERGVKWAPQNFQLSSLARWSHQLGSADGQSHCLESLLRFTASRDAVCQALYAGFCKPCPVLWFPVFKPAHLSSVSCEALSGLPGRCSTEWGNWMHTLWKSIDAEDPLDVALCKPNGKTMKSDCSHSSYVLMNFFFQFLLYSVIQ